MRPSRPGLLLAAALLLPCAPASAETFELHFYRYCAPGTLCGHASLAEYDRYILEAVEEMNAIWKPTGFSFRPTVFPVDSTSPADPTGLPPGKTKYYQTSGCTDSEDDRAARDHWRQGVAKADPGAISMMLTKGTNRCCSGIPRTFKKLTEEYGVFCDAHPNRTIRGLGSMWAHEVGHHWSLSHTHGGCADTADGENPTSDADSGVPKACNADNPDGLRPECDTNADCGGFGMCVADALPSVGDTPADRCGFEGCKEKCQGDPDEKACTTDADCDPGEGPCACPGADEDDLGAILDDHTWFGSLLNERKLVPVATDVSYGSPHGTWCPVHIKTRSGGVTGGSDTVPPVEVTVRDVMSYHSFACRGPYVVSGVRREAFSPDQLARIAACRTQIYPRDEIHLPDVCATRGGDTDSDGICDLDDNCSSVRNTAQIDSDSDGFGDACDCPGSPPTDDLDGDGIPDACDIDRDGDGCSNDPAEDDHPDEAQLLHTTRVYVGCGVDSESTYVSDIADTDGDGTPNCRDPDDDNDGLCDAPGPGCAQVGDPCPEVTGIFCILPVPGGPCPPEWTLCGIDCVALFLKVVQLINPDPTQDLAFERFSIVNRSFYAPPLRGMTAAESVLAISSMVEGEAAGGPAGSGLVAAAALGRVRLEIWQRLRLGGERFVATVGEYDASGLRLGELVRGGVVRLTPLTDPTTGAPLLEAETTYGIGLRADEALDSDRDGQPDLLDNCGATPNPGQADADGDGFGDACDADLDGDGATDAQDVARVRACEGADLSVEVPILEPAEFEGEPLGDPLPAPDALAAALAALCRAADLDGDGDVDANDTAITAGRLGQPPGPSAVRPGFSPAPPSFAPACVDGATIAPGRLVLSKLHLPPASQHVALRGEVVLPVPFTPPLDPFTRGLRLTIRDATGAPVLEASIPPGAYSKQTGAGWKGKGTRVRYVNPAGLSGLRRVAVAWDESGHVKVRVAGTGAGLSPGARALPLLWDLNLAPDVAATRQCGHSDFLVPPERPSCAVKRGGVVVACR